jgi:acetyl-CoA C-acetyltransferase
MAEKVFMLSAQRTPIGSYLGVFAGLSAPELGAIAIRAALARSNLTADLVDQVFVGNVLSAGLGQAPARQAALKAGIPSSVPATTINKVCGSSLEAVIQGVRCIELGEAEIVVAAGMESMSRVPYYLLQARSGYRMGNSTVIDGMIFDGLHDPYNDFHMGVAGELCVEKYELTRRAQDDFARESYHRARRAQEQGHFLEEIVPVPVPQRKGSPLEISKDEEPERADLERFSSLRPAFKADGTITAGNASSINDGAAAIVLCSEQVVRRSKLVPLARIVGHAGAAAAPEWFTIAPIQASQRLLEKLHLTVGDIDLWEINEAFACVAMVCSRQLGLDSTRVNVQGGAVALGHPIGATGARLLTTLSHSLRRRGVNRGIAALCIGGGEALAVAIEATPPQARF